MSNVLTKVLAPGLVPPGEAPPTPTTFPPEVRWVQVWVPGTPGRPAYCVDVITKVPVYKVIYTIPGGVAGNPGGPVLIQIGTKEVATHTCYPATSGTPGHYETVSNNPATDPGTPKPPSAPPPQRVPMQIHTGWDAGAVSVGSLIGDGWFEFSIGPNTAGAVVGLNDVSLGTTYTDIDFAFYCDSYFYQIYENGVPVGAHGTYSDATVFSISRSAGVVTYFVDSIAVYTSTKVTDVELRADCSLFASLDSIVNAALFVGTPLSVDLSCDIGASGPENPAYWANIDAAQIRSEAPPPQTDWYDAAEALIYHNTAHVAAEGPSNSTYWANVNGARVISLAPDPSTYWYDFTESTILLNALQIRSQFAAQKTLWNGSPGDGTHYSSFSSFFPEPLLEFGADFITPPYCFISSYPELDPSTFWLALNGYACAIEDHFPQEQTYLANIEGAQYFVQGPSSEAFWFNTDAPLPSTGEMRAVGKPGRLFAFGHTSTAYGMVATGVAGTLEARGGAIAKLTGPSPHLSATGTTIDIGIANMVGAVGTLSAGGTTTDIGKMVAVHKTKYQVLGIGGGVAKLKSGAGTLTASGTPAILGRAVLTSHAGFLVATGYTTNVGRAIMVGPPLRVVPSGIMRAVGPRPRLVATGYAVLSTAYEAYSITLLELANGQSGIAATRFTNYPFDRLLRFRDKYYGLGTDGLYELVGDTFDGDPIVAEIVTAETDFGRREHKRATAMYLSGRVGADMDLSVVSSENETDQYFTYRPVVKADASTHRALFGKGIKYTYIGYKFTNVDGEDFALNSFTPEIDTLKRTI